MRSNRQLTYDIEQIPPAQPIFDLIKKYSGSNDRDMYDTYNMGAGFAVFAPAEQVKTIQKIAKKLGIASYDAGSVKKGAKKLIINPLNLEFTQADMTIR